MVQGSGQLDIIDPSASDKRVPSSIDPGKAKIKCIAIIGPPPEVLFVTSLILLVTQIGTRSLFKPKTLKDLRHWDLNF